MTSQAEDDMDKNKQQRLKDAGWKIGSAAEFLELSPEEAEFVEQKVALSSTFKGRRQDTGLSQGALAKKLGRGMRTRLVLACLALLAGCRSVGAPVPDPVPLPLPPDAFAIVAEADRLAARDLWPGFDPRTVPVAIHDGERTLLFRHPSPPAGFEPVPGRDGVHAYPGRYPSVLANSTVEIGGVVTATMIPTTGAISLVRRAGTLIHEAFHAYQRAHHPGWGANEADLFTYPVYDVVLLTLRRMEAESLRRALVADRREEAACWAQAALAFRDERFARMDAGAAAYERDTEQFEGLAYYVEGRATGVPDVAIIPEAGFAPGAVRQRGYAAGAAMARLLDRFAPAWPGALAQDDTTALDVLLAATLAPPEGSTDGCGLTPAERSRIQATSAADVEALRAHRAGQRRAFLEQPGWTLVVEAAAAPLFPQGFDPLNLQTVRPGEVLHTRYVKLGSPAGTVEVLDHSALTEAAGEHPLFNGVRRVTVTGLASEPRVAEDDGVVTVAADGISVELRGASVERAGQTVTVRLETP
jgi:hypothetical protein